MSSVCRNRVIRPGDADIIVVTTEYISLKSKEYTTRLVVAVVYTVQTARRGRKVQYRVGLDCCLGEAM